MDNKYLVALGKAFTLNLIIFMGFTLVYSITRFLIHGDISGPLFRTYYKIVYLNVIIVFFLFLTYFCYKAHKEEI